MKSLVRFSLMALGIIFVSVGILGIFLPILQGIIFLVPGVYLLSITSTYCKNLLDRALSKYPRVKTVYERHVDRFEKLWKKSPTTEPKP